MVASESSFTNSFYFYLPTAREVGVRLPFFFFMVEVIKIFHVAPPKSHPIDEVGLWNLRLHVDG